MLEEKKIGFIGGGQMCEALISGLLLSGRYRNTNISVTDISTERLDYLRHTYGITVLQNDRENENAKLLAQTCDMLVLAVKPQTARDILAAVSDSFRPGSMVISIMGGVTLALLEKYVKQNPLFRVMPNTSMTVGKGVAGITVGRNVTEQEKEQCKELFDTVGLTCFVPEQWMEPLTGISGCGPAFAYIFIEAMADGGVEQGLPRELAQKLAAQTLAGAGEMVLKTGRHPASLKDSVCSPGGSTIAGVHALEQNSFRTAVMDAVGRSCERMEEIGKRT